MHDNIETFPPLMNAEQCARLLFLKSGREALRLARLRKIPSVRVGKRKLFLLTEVLETLRLRQTRVIEDRELGRVAER